MKKVLIVEDNVSLKLILSKLITMAGYEVTSTSLWHRSNRPFKKSKIRHSHRRLPITRNHRVRYIPRNSKPTDKKDINLCLR